jgi:multiple sugar transport system substrate-binding protein
MPARLLLLTLGLLLAGCGSDDAEDKAPATRAAKPPITISLSADGEELKLYEEVARAYEGSGGGKVTVNGIGDRKDFLARLTSSFAARRPPDAFLINHRFAGGYIERGVVEPAGPRLGDDEKDFYPVALDAFRSGGAVQCVPQNASSLVVYYNRDLFEGAGVALPSSGWSLETLRDAAAELTGGKVHGVGVEPSVIRAAPFVWSSGGEIVDATDAPTKFTFDAPAAKPGLEALLSLAASGPDAEEVESKALDERFLSGELAMFFSSRREVPTFRTITDFDWDVAPFPSIDGNSTTVLHTDGWCLSKGAKVDAAWDFVRFATGPGGSKILARGGRTVPSLTSVAQSPDFLDASAPPASNQVFLDGIEHMKRLPTTANWEKVEERANEALEQAFYGRSSLGAALRKIADETAGGF